jgi:hypothetical protein
MSDLSLRPTGSRPTRLHPRTSPLAMPGQLLAVAGLPELANLPLDLGERARDDRHPGFLEHVADGAGTPSMLKTPRRCRRSRSDPG